MAIIRLPTISTTVRIALALTLTAILLAGHAQAQVPQLINYQGRVVVGATDFNGSGQFAFALVNANGTTTYWSNDGTSTAGSRPTHSVTLVVGKGLYSLLLGDSMLTNMTAIPNSVFANSDVRLRVWFNDGTNGWQLLSPDQRIAAVGYAMVAGSVPNGAITSAQIANGAIGSTQIAAGAVGSTQLASTITFANLTTSGNLALPATSSDGSAGVITLGGNAYLQAPGTNNLFFGLDAGNLTLSGYENVAFGTQALTHLTSGLSNTAAGGEALENNTIGNYNTALGNRALFSAKTPSDNTSVGYNALGGNAAAFNPTTGSDNTAVGYQALDDLSSGGHNTALGSAALQANTTSADNTAVGYQALSVNTATENTAIGSQALAANTTATNNTAVGFQALAANTTATNNTAVGFQALAANTATSNTAVGSQALTSCTTGTGNIAIGAGTGTSIISGVDDVYIGNNINGAADESYTIRIGQNFGAFNYYYPTATYIGGVYGVTSPDQAIAVGIDVSGQLVTTSSSRRFKRDIKDMGDASNVLLSLRPVTFHYKTDRANRPHFGLIAEEVDKVDPALVARDGKGQIYTVCYDAVNAMLLNEFLKQHAQVMKQQAQAEKQQQEFLEQQKEIKDLKAELDELDELKPRPAAPMSFD
jgi:hypothetical protein